MKRLAALAAGILAAFGPGMLSMSSDAGAITTTPTVTAVVPAHGPTVLPAGGWLVTITGTNFGTVTAANGVTFGGVNAVSYSVRSNSVIKAFAPAGSAGTVDVVVTNASGSSPTTAADAFTYVSSGPVIDNVRPNDGPASGGNKVFIGGANFDPSCTTVTFGGVPALAGSVTVESVDAITARVPSGAIGSTVDVQVSCTSGATPTDPGDHYTYLPPNPQVAAVVFDVGSLAGGENVTIIGKKFIKGATVNFGANSATVIHRTSTELIVTAPAATQAGVVDITVVTSRGASLTGLQDEYFYSSQCPCGTP